MAKDKIISYYFSHLRRGLGASIRPGVGSGEKRARVEVKFNVNFIDKEDNKGKAEVEQKVAMYGPGDVLGFNASKMILRVHPTPDDGNFTANNIPFVEFTEPDFLWRYSATQTNGKWIPWLSLIVLKMADIGEEGEFTFDESSKPGLPPKIKLKHNNKSILPDLSASWRWAHVYCNDVEGKGPHQLQAKIKKDPSFAISRLFCARRLQAGTKYCAFIVPTYLLGIETALGVEEVTRTTRTDEEAPGTSREDLAWTGNGSLQNDLIFTEGLPYYFHWEFRAGLRGDFEDLIRRIKPNPIRNLGGKDIDISNPGYGFLGPDRKSIQIDGALQSSDQNENEENPLTNDEVKQLSELLNTAEVSENSKLRVVPPIYGRWINHKEVADVDLYPAKINQNWMEMLNLNLGYRIAAGLGVQYVKENQEELMKAAWDQLERISREARSRNQSRFGRELTTIFHKRIDQLRERAPLTYNSFMAPVTNRLITNNVEDEQPTNVPFSSAANAPMPLLKPTSRKLFTGGINNLPKLNIPNLTFETVENKLKETISLRLRLSNISNIRLHPKQRKYQVSRSFVFSDQKNVKNWLVDTIVPSKIGTERMKISSRFVRKEKDKEADETQVKIEEINKKISIQLNPEVSRWKHRAVNSISYQNWASLKSTFSIQADEDPLETPMAYPEFHAPMYKYLLELSEEYFMPGLDKVPQNTVSVLLTNRKFIESFMMGLNHEFAAELRWRGYKTDLRGSYFRRFWDTTIYSMDDKEKEEFKASSYGIALLQETELNWDKIVEAYYEAPNRGAADAYEEAAENWLAEHGLNKEIADLSDAEHQQFQDSDQGKELIEKAGMDWPKIKTAYQSKLVAEAYEEAVENWMLTREFDKDIAPLHTWREGTKLGVFTVRRVIANEYFIAINRWMGNSQPVSPKEAKRLAFRTTEEGKQLLHTLGLTDKYWEEIERIFNDHHEQEDDNELVLMIRAEVLQKFSNTFVYLVKGEMLEVDDRDEPVKRAKWGEANVVYPIFEANLPPDIVCLGFSISEDNARGISRGQEGNVIKTDPGYFIVFEERLSEQRYGLDVKKSNEMDIPDGLNDKEKEDLIVENMSWEHFEVSEGDYLDNAKLNFEDLPEELGDTSQIVSNWENSAPFIARVFTQKQVRMLVDLNKILP